MFHIELNEIGLIMIKKSSEDDLSDYIKGNSDVYIKIIEDILPSIVLNFRRVPDCGNIPCYTPFKCLHCFHAGCLGHWEIMDYL